MTHAVQEASASGFGNKLIHFSSSKEISADNSTFPSVAIMQFGVVILVRLSNITKSYIRYVGQATENQRLARNEFFSAGCDIRDEVAELK